MKSLGKQKRESGEKLQQNKEFIRPGSDAPAAG
jgi:hypothetical protein